MRSAASRGSAGNTLNPRAACTRSCQAPSPLPPSRKFQLPQSSPSTVLVVQQPSLDGHRPSNNFHPSTPAQTYGSDHVPNHPDVLLLGASAALRGSASNCGRKIVVGLCHLGGPTRLGLPHSYVTPAQIHMPDHSAFRLPAASAAPRSPANTQSPRVACTRCCQAPYWTQQPPSAAAVSQTASAVSQSLSWG